MSDERIDELEAEVQALMQEAEMQKRVNAELYAGLRRLREHLGITADGDVWARLKEQRQP